MKKLISNALILSTLVILLACDKIPLEKVQKKPLPVLKCTDPIKIINHSDTTVVLKKIYLEYFTGHLCGNCPQNSGAAFSQIEAAFPSKVVITKIHSNFFARAQPPKYTNNFTNPIGDRIYGDFNVNSVPTGMIDRAFYKNNMLMSPSEWINAVKERSNITPSAQLIVNTEYCESARTLLVNATIRLLNAYNSGISIVGYISENNIVGMQLDYTEGLPSKDVADFVHKYVLRDELSISESFAPAASYSKGSELVTTFAANLKAGWNEKECYVTVLIRDQKSNEVLQVEQVKIYPKK